MDSSGRQYSAEIRIPNILIRSTGVYDFEFNVIMFCDCDMFCDKYIECVSDWIDFILVSNPPISYPNSITYSNLRRQSVWQNYMIRANVNVPNILVDVKFKIF